MSLILIVEGSRDMAAAASEVLERAGHASIAATAAAEAISMCRESRPDLVLTEYHIQDGAGLELLEGLTRLTPAPPVFIVAGCGNEAAAARAAALGACGYAVKTGTYLRDLPAIVEKALDALALKRDALERETTKCRLQAQSELAGWLAHNFKNILAASIGSLNLIDLKNAEQDPARQAEYLADSRRSQESAVALLEQLIRMTEEGDGEIEQVVVSEVVDEAWEATRSKMLTSLQAGPAESFARDRDKIGRMPFLNATRRLPPQRMVRGELRSILEALLQNALEAVMETLEPRILVQGGLAAGGRLELIVRDNGRGMSAGVLRHAVEPLFSTKGEVGVGLSLTLVRALAIRRGGVLSIDSTPGAGTTVKMAFPA
ncbi:MAG: response regulator [Candidatus Adiutrix sp.]|nr:response regulator [Candidatus Adiutrix sp.]